MAESKRQGHKPVTTHDERVQVQKERWFLVTFLLGGIALVAGMLWIADGLSDNFKVNTATFIVFATAGGLSGVSAVLSKLLLKEKA